MLSTAGVSSSLLKRRWRRPLTAAPLVGVLALAASGLAQADVITSVNGALLNIVRSTSASLIDGPPEVAREIAMIDGSMFNAVSAASSKSFAPVAFAGRTISGASADAAALQAAITVMDSLYEGPGSLYQQYKGVTGAQYYGFTSPYRNTLVGPSVKQMNDVATQIAGLVTDLASLGSSSGVTTGIILGTQAGNAMIAARANDGSTAANLQTLMPFVPPNNGQPGVYVPPTGRPAMTPTWGTVAPFGMTGATLGALAATTPPPPAITSRTYADQILQTECGGTGTALPAAIESVCAANGYYPEFAAETGAALFWNDPGGTFQPPGHWLQIADTVAASQNLTLLAHAREDALVGEALSDAGSAVWALKYTFNLWRPVDAIRDCSGWSPSFTTCDPTWSSLIGLPPHPDYVAGHPGFSGAAATVLANFFGNDNIEFSSTSNAYCNAGVAVTDANGNTTACVLSAIAYTDCNNAPIEYGGFAVTDPQYNASPLICPITEDFSSFSQASSGFLGAEFSRVVGGIHTPIAVENASVLGNAIGATLVAEPPILSVLAMGLLALGLVQRWHKAHVIHGALPIAPPWSTALFAGILIRLTTEADGDRLGAPARLQIPRPRLGHLTKPPRRCAN